MPSLSDLAGFPRGARAYGGDASLGGEATMRAPVSDDWFAQQGAPSGGPTGMVQGGDAEAFIRQYQATHDPREPLDGLIAALNAQGIAAKPYLYGSTASNNEIDLPGVGKYKVKAAEDSPNPLWFTGWDDTGGGGAGGGIGFGLENTPGYQFRLGEGLKALERSAAARGTLLTGGTLKGLQRYAQDVASTEYGNRVGQLQNLASLGYGAAGQQANLGAAQAGSMADLITGGGNAAAAGTIGAGNAVQQGLGSLTNLAQNLYLARLMGGGAGGGGV